MTVRHPVHRALASLVVVLVVVLATAGLGARPADASTTRESYVAFLDTDAMTYSAGAGATENRDVVLTGAGYAEGLVTTTAATSRVMLNAEAESCNGAPQVTASVDGVVYLGRRIYGNGQYALVGSWPAGQHRIRFSMIGDAAAAGCDRQITFYSIGFVGYTDGTPYPIRTGQTAHLDAAGITPSAGVVRSRWSLDLSRTTTVAVRQDSQGARTVQLSAWTPACTGGRPRLRFAMDGTTLYDGLAPLGGASGLSFPGRWSSGPHDLVVTVDMGSVTGDCTARVIVAAPWFTGLA